MQRWFYANEEEVCVKSPPPTSTSSSTSAEIPAPPPPAKQWRFCVSMPCHIMCNEHLAVVGDCDLLGNWQLEDCVLMEKYEEDSNIWCVNIAIPSERDIKYRFLVVAIDPTSKKMIVRRWETHLESRVVKVDDLEPPEISCSEIFGVYKGQCKIDRGWLTSEIVVQFKVFNAPFRFKQPMKQRLLYAKVTPMNLRIPQNCDNQPLANYAFMPPSSLNEEHLSSAENSRDATYEQSTAFAFNEVTTLNKSDGHLHGQPQFGTACGADDLVIFHLTIGDFENTAYLFDLYTYSSKAAADQLPYHFGYHYVLPNLLKKSEGHFDVTITCASKHRPIGTMRLGYLIVRPMPSPLNDMKISYSRYWNPKFIGLDIGHRGSGTSFKAEESKYRENTIFSLKQAAEHGADMVEFDVMLSKDLVPIVYHDYWVYVSLNSKMRKQDYLALPVRDLTLEQLNTLKVFHTNEIRLKKKRCFDDHDLAEHQPFPQLADVLDALDPYVGFNIEIKWSQKMFDGSMEDKFVQDVDRNLYVNVILDLVLRKGADRRIIFSCFDPDICTMLRFKQNRYPVMFLTQSLCEINKYMDPRGRNFEYSVYNATAMELLGIVSSSQDLLCDNSKINFIKEHNLVLFCWGDENNSRDTIQSLKNMGLHGIIYDKMQDLSNKEHSVFHLHATESQKEVLQIQSIALEEFLNPAPKPESQMCD